MAARREWIGLALAVAIAAAAGACGEAKEARFAATCAPDPGMARVTCTVRNRGTRAGRACITPRVQPPRSAPIIGQRACTGVVEPGGSLEIHARFDQIARARRDRTLASRCAKGGTWECTTDVVEDSSRAMTENAPPMP